jgi:hypothetical protein
MMRKACLKWNPVRAVALLVFSTAGAAADLARITVGVIPYADIPRRTLSEAENKVGRTLRKAGLEIVWVHLPGNGHPFESSSASVAEPKRITIKILTRDMTVQLALNPAELGLALLDSETSLGSEAYVFFDRVEEEAAYRDTDITVVLSSAITHEIGHLLLGTNEHSPTGVMRGKWNRDAFKRAALGQMTFTPQQSEAMKSRIRSRLAAANASLRASRE